MNRRLVLRRAAVSVFSLYLVVTVLFFAVTLVPDPSPAILNYHNHFDEIPALIAAKGRNATALQQYVSYLQSIATLDWGRSVTRLGGYGPKVTTLLQRAAPVTLMYTVPAVIVGFTGGIGLGVYAAVNHGGYVDKAVQTVGYLGFGLPNLFLAEIALFAFTVHFELVEFSLGTSAGKYYNLSRGIDIWAMDSLVQFAVIAAVLSITLVGGQVRYARAECLEYVQADFVRVARAKGASEFRVMAHIVRRAGLPLLALFLADLVSILVVHVFVLEFVFDIPGLGQLGLASLFARDTATTMGVVIVVVTFGVVANFLQDVGLGVLEPRLQQN